MSKILSVGILIILFFIGIVTGTINPIAFITNLNEDSDIRERVVAVTISVWSFFIALLSLILAKSILSSPEKTADNKNNNGFTIMITLFLIILLFLRLMFNAISY